jgi:two-component system chemotaxis response regulator CheB
MPVMDGLETLRHIRREYPHLRVVMFSTLTERGAQTTLMALSLGAEDYVAKASNMGSLDRSMASLREELLPKIRQFFRMPAIEPARSEGAFVPAPPLHAGAGRALRAIVIGISTGGPAALGAILPDLPAGFPLPVLVVQHMPPQFTRLLAERLNSTCRLPATEASQNEPIEPGKIYLAPGDYHMKVALHGGEARILLDQGPHLNSCRPAVDALFASASEVYGGAVVAAVLTGMGQDGMRGAQLLKAQGATILAQDEASSVVWGMPGSVVQAGLADRVLPLDRIVPEIVSLAGPVRGGVHADEFVRV